MRRSPRTWSLTAKALAALNNADPARVPLLAVPFRDERRDRKRT